MTIDIPTIDAQEQLHEQLLGLTLEHRALDETIEALSEEAFIDEIKLRRLKKRKLALKDAIAKIESKLLPDIIA